MPCENKINGGLTVAICTFRRQQGLSKLLDALWLQENIRSMNIEVLVVDNDPNASACDFISKIKPPTSLWNLHYFLEPTPGVSHARNRCLAESKTEFIVFIDDDEVPQPKWLSSLMQTQSLTGADVVCGPVIPRYESEPPKWIIENRLFERKRFSTGCKIGFQDSRSGNVLLRCNVVDLAGGGFDAQFAMSGAEDTLFFKRAEQSGARMVWSDEACVLEDVPPSRMKFKWVLRRAYKGGQNWVRICAVSNSFVWLPMAIRGLAAVAMALVLMIPMLVFSKAAAIQLATRMAGGMGKATAWWAARKAKRQFGTEHYVG